jgi:hypothetical protein
MEAHELARFFLAVGHRVIETQSCYWYNSQPFLYKSLPVHRFVDPSSTELARVLMTGPALAVRFPKAPNHVGPRGGLYVTSNRNYDLPSLSQNVRSRTRRGLARCRIQQIQFEYLAQHGYALSADTTMRQMGKLPNTSEAYWHRFCDKTRCSRDFEAWGAFVGDRLATFLVGMLVEDCYYIYLQKSASDLLKYYPNNALLFTVTKAKLACPEVSFVLHGHKALAVGKGLDYYRTSMGFEVRPFRDQVVFNPLVKPFLMWKGDALISKLVKRYPDNLFWLRASRALRVAKGEDPQTEDDASM